MKLRIVIDDNGYDGDQIEVDIWGDREDCATIGRAKDGKRDVDDDTKTTLLRALKDAQCNTEKLTMEIKRRVENEERRLKKLREQRGKVARRR